MPEVGDTKWHGCETAKYGMVYSMAPSKNCCKKPVPGASNERVGRVSGEETLTFDDIYIYRYIHKFNLYIYIYTYIYNYVYIYIINLQGQE